MFKTCSTREKYKLFRRKIKINVDCIKGHQKDFTIKIYFEETIKISVKSLKVYQKEIVQKQKNVKKANKDLKMKSAMFILN